jgi:phosphomannomutase
VRVLSFSTETKHSFTCRIQERNEFEALDLVTKSLVVPEWNLRPRQKHGYRTGLIQALQQKFPDYGLTYSIGGQISFDVFPNGWDKTYALKHVEDEGFEEIHFFGDKTYKVSPFASALQNFTDVE